MNVLPSDESAVRSGGDFRSRQVTGWIQFMGLDPKRRLGNGLCRKPNKRKGGTPSSHADAFDSYRTGADVPGDFPTRTLRLRKAKPVNT